MLEGGPVPYLLAVYEHALAALRSHWLAVYDARACGSAQSLFDFYNVSKYRDRVGTHTYLQLA